MLTRLQLDRTEPFAEGTNFGEAGAYVRLMGTAYGKLDPHHVLHICIVDLEKAPRNVRGCVAYEMDVYILQPADAARGSRTLLYEVNNRGRKMVLPVLHEAQETSPGALNDPTTLADAGNGFAFQRAIPWRGAVGIRMSHGPITAWAYGYPLPQSRGGPLLKPFEMNSFLACAFPLRVRPLP